MEQAYPLHWPVGRPRTEPHKRKWSRFDVTPDRAQREMHEQIQRMGGKNIIVSSDGKQRRDGGLYAQDLRGQEVDPGVAVYFERKGIRVCFCCDIYPRIWENMRAIGKTIEAMRGIERWGTAEMLDQAFTGFAALPAPETKKSWREVMGVDASYTPDKEWLVKLYHRLAKNRHPDSSTGSTEKFQELQLAFNEAKEALGF